MIDLCRNLNLACVIEGMETKEQADVLCKLGGVMMQGYYFGKPMLAAAVPGFFAAAVKRGPSARWIGRGVNLKLFHNRNGVRRKRKFASGSRPAAAGIRSACPLRLFGRPKPSIRCRPTSPKIERPGWAEPVRKPDAAPRPFEPLLGRGGGQTFGAAIPLFPRCFFAERARGNG